MTSALHDSQLLLDVGIEVGHRKVVVVRNVLAASRLLAREGIKTDVLALGATSESSITAAEIAVAALETPLMQFRTIWGSDGTAVVQAVFSYVDTAGHNSLTPSYRASLLDIDVVMKPFH